MVGPCAVEEYLLPIAMDSLHEFFSSMQGYISAEIHCSFCKISGM